MKKKKTRWRRPIEYPCERCGAKPNKQCRTAKGGEAFYVHKCRLDMAHRNKRPTDAMGIEADAGELLDDGVTRRDEQGHIPPQLPNAWRVAFLRSTLRTGFCLALTQPMLEQLCAVAARVWWDRSVFRSSLGLAAPANPVTMASLQRRGLVRHRGTQVLRDEDTARHPDEKFQRWHDNICDIWELTPAGEKLVELLQVTGVYLEQTAETELKARAQAEGS